MEVKASAKYIRISPQKLRMLTRGLRGLSPSQAVLRLERYPQKGSEFLAKVVKQARANAVNNFKLLDENLRIKRVEIGQGPVFKRMDRSHGARFDRGVITKKTAHIFLTLEAKEEKAVEAKKETKKAGQASKVNKVRKVSKVSKGARSKTKEE